MTSFFIQISPFSDADEPQPHLPVTAMTTKPSQEGLNATKPAQSPASVTNATGHFTGEAPTGEVGEYSFIRGQFVGLLLHVTAYKDGDAFIGFDPDSPMKAFSNFVGPIVLTMIEYY